MIKIYSIMISPKSIYVFKFIILSIQAGTSAIIADDDTALIGTPGTCE